MGINVRGKKESAWMININILDELGPKACDTI